MTSTHAEAGSRTFSPDLLGVYLNDHLAGATAGAALARRIATTQRETVAGGVLRQCADEVAEDRAALVSLMRTLDVPVRRYKVGAGWLAEKLSRLKLNGRVAARSPSTTIIDLETLRLGVEGKACVWQVLRNLADHDARLDVARLDGLIDRARRQVDALEELRVRAAETVFGGRRTEHRRSSDGAPQAGNGAARSTSSRPRSRSSSKP